MAKLVLVWNPEKTECVGFMERAPNSANFDCGSDGDAEHAGGGEKWGVVSSLADMFREQYEGTDDECHLQVIEVDETKATPIERVED